MAGLFDSFNKTMGVDPNKIDGQQTETAVAVGNYTRDLSGSNSRPDAALSMANGRHAMSSAVLNGYAVAGKEVDAKVLGMMDELDQLAVASQSIAAMDNRTRINLIARGNHGADPARIKAKEAELLRKIGDSTRDVLLEDKQIKRILARQSVETGSQRIRSNEQGIIQNDINIQKQLRSAETELEMKRYTEITKDMTAKQLQDAYNGDGITGVPRIALSSIMQDRAKKEFDTANNLLAMNPKNAGLFGFGSTGGRTRAGSKSRSVNAQINDQVDSLSIRSNSTILGEVLENNAETNLLAAKNGETIDPAQLVEVPGIGTTTVGVVQMAMTKALERENKLTEAQGASFNIQAPIVDRKYAATMTRFSEQLKSLGIDPNNPKSNVGQVMYAAQDQYRLAINSGDIGAANEAVEKIDNLRKEIVTDLIDSDNIPEERKGFLEELTLTGKPRSIEATVNFTASVAGNQLAIAARQNPAFENLADYTNLVIGNAQRAKEANNTPNDPDAPFDPNAPDVEKFTNEDAKKILEDNFESGQGAAIMINDTAELIVSDTLYNIFGEMIDSAREAGDFNALGAAERARQVVFGDNHAAKKIVGDGVKFRLRREIDYVGITSKGDTQSFTNADGSNATVDSVNVDIMFDLLAPLSHKLKESGVNMNISNELITRLKQNKPQYVQMLRPQNPEQKALLASVSSRYMLDQYSDDTQAMNEVLTLAINGIENAIDGDESNNKAENIFNNMNNDEKEKWINDRVETILDRYEPDGNTRVPRQHRRMQAVRQARKDMEQIALGEEIDNELDLSSIVDSLFE